MPTLFKGAACIWFIWPHPSTSGRILMHNYKHTATAVSHASAGAVRVIEYSLIYREHGLRGF